MQESRKTCGKGAGRSFVSRTPYGEEYQFDPEREAGRERIDRFLERNTAEKTVVIQGLGFVGSAMLTAVASARDPKGRPRYAVIGVDLPTPQSYWKVGRINAGLLPIVSSDEWMEAVFRENFERGHILATTNPYAYEVADVLVVDINLDVQKKAPGHAQGRSVDLGPLKEAVRQVAERMKPTCLVVVESTVPPGACEKVLLPLIEAEFKRRGLEGRPVHLAHSYERVMPGKNYLRSITEFYRVFSGLNETARKEVRAFLESFINTERFPLSEVSSTTASEIGKVLENSFRAANIAFIQEWTEFAEAAGVNLFEVIGAIRKRDTHKNIMLPGFGVGGYCLTKDPLMADWAYGDLFGGAGALAMSVEAVNINDLMPLHSFRLLQRALGDLSGKDLVLMGVSYLNNVADTRNSPSETFYRACMKAGATVRLHDPLVRHWSELDLPVETSVERLAGGHADAVVMAVRHQEYGALTADDFELMLKPGGLVLDTNNVISDEQADRLRQCGFRLVGVGKGHWNLYRDA